MVHSEIGIGKLGSWCGLAQSHHMTIVDVCGSVYLATLPSSGNCTPGFLEGNFPSPNLCHPGGADPYPRAPGISKWLRFAWIPTQLMSGPSDWPRDEHVILPCPASGFISPHSPCLLCCPTRDFFQFFRSVVLPHHRSCCFFGLKQSFSLAYSTWFTPLLITNSLLFTHSSLAQRPLW